MDFLYWCTDPQLCQVFDKYNYINMNAYPKDIVMKGNHPIPGQPRHIYGGIYALSRLGMLGSGISSGYLRDACIQDPIFLVAIEKMKPAAYPIREDTLSFIQSTRILGCITAKIHNDRCIEIDTVSSRSHHTGVGANLMATLLEVAKYGSFNVCLLNALVSAMGFYMKLGFTYLGTDPEMTPIFAVDLTKMDTQPPRLHLQRESSNVPVPIDDRPLDVVEKALLGKYYTRVARDLSMQTYIDDIGTLAIDTPWSYLDQGIRMKHGFLIPGKETTKDPNRSYLVRIPTFLHQRIGRTHNRSRSKSKSKSRSGSRPKTFKVSTYLHKPLRSTSKNKPSNQLV